MDFKLIKGLAKRKKSSEKSKTSNGGAKRIQLDKKKFKAFQKAFKR